MMGMETMVVDVTEVSIFYFSRYHDLPEDTEWNERLVLAGMKPDASDCHDGSCRDSHVDARQAWAGRGTAAALAHRHHFRSDGAVATGAYRIAVMLTGRVRSLPQQFLPWLRASPK